MIWKDWAAVALILTAAIAAAAAVEPTVQRLVDADDNTSTGYGGELGADVMVACTDGVCQLYGTYEDAWVERLGVNIFVVDADGNLVDMGGYSGPLILCDVCDTDGDGRRTLRDLAVCLNGLEGP